MLHRLEMLHRRLRPLLVGFTSFVVSAAAANADTRRVSVGQNEVAVTTVGGSGPTIVFESGQAEGAASWQAAARRLALCTRVVLYDRPGTGHSSPRVEPVLTAAQAATELWMLLGAIDARPPYILVGHSLGGLYVQAAARAHPADVAGVVLVDASSPLEPDGIFVSAVVPKRGTTAAAEEAGVVPSMAALRSGPPFPSVPLVVLIAETHNDTPDREALWREIQEKTAALSPDGKAVVVPGSGHYIQTDRSDAVVEAVLQVAAVGGRKLDCR